MGSAFFEAEMLVYMRRIADTLEDLLEVQRTEPLTKIIHPSMLRPQPPKEEENENQSDL